MSPALSLTLRPTTRLGRIGARCARSEAGVAAIEFALILPLMVLMLLGLTEVTYGVNMDRKLTLLTRSLADLSSRSDKMTTAEMQNIFAAARAVMTPYDTSKVGMTVSSVAVTQSGSNYTGAIEWSCTSGFSPTTRSTGSAYPVPSGFTVGGKSFMLVETKLPYTPIFGHALKQVINLGETTPWPVRNVDRVTAPSPCPT